MLPKVLFMYFMSLVFQVPGDASRYPAAETSKKVSFCCFYLTIADTKHFLTKVSKNFKENVTGHISSLCG